LSSHKPAFPLPQPKSVAPPYSRAKIYAARLSRGSSCRRSISAAARARAQQQTGRRRHFTLDVRAPELSSKPAAAAISR